MLTAQQLDAAAATCDVPAKYADKAAQYRAGVRDALAERRKVDLASEAYVAGYEAMWRLR